MSSAKSRIAKPVALTRASSRLLQRKCDCGTHAVGGECRKCKDGKAKDEKAKAPLQRAATKEAKATETPPVVQEALKEPGRPLDAATRAFMESKFGHDFSGVRVHTGAKAAQSAHAVHARAYTVGNDIVFAAGQYEPASPAGRHLLAHELAHTMQQDGKLQTSPDADALTIAPAGGSLEREAEVAADAVLAGRAPAVAARAAGGILFRAPATVKTPTLTATALGIEAHDTIQEDFLAKLKGMPAFKELELPGGSFSGQREGSGKTSGASGWIDLALHDGKNLRVGEIKPAGGETGFGPSVIEGAVQVQHYIDVGNAMDRDAWRKAFPGGNKVPLPITDVVRLTAADYKPTPKMNTLKSKVEIQVAWLRDGIVTYQKTGGPGATAADYEPFAVAFAGKNYPFQIIKGTPETRLGLHTDNLSALMDFRRANHVQLQSAKRKSANRIEFKGVFGTHSEMNGHPFFRSTPGDFITFFTDPNAAVHELSVAGKGKHKAHFEGLSEVTVEVEQGENGLTARGPLKTNLPLLRNAPIEVEVSANRVAAVIKGDPEKIKSPIPGLRFTEAALSFLVSPELRAEGRLGFAIGSPKKPLADGALTLSADTNGLIASGKVYAHVPGLSQAEGTIQYGNGELTGEIKIGADKVNIPGVTSASLLLGVSNKKGVSFDGTVGVKLPTGQPAELTVRKHGERFIYGGKATIDVPALKPVEFNVEYDGEHFTGEGKTGFTHLGLDGDLHVRYRSGEAGPEFTGDGKLQVKHGKAKGEVAVHMNKDHKFSGKGDITYQLTDNLIAGAGVILSEEGKLRVNGLLKFLKPIQLFRAFEDKKELFHLTQQIPIPGLSIGPVGVIAEIGVSFGVSYGVGPGELRDVQVQAGFDPLEENKNLELAGGALVVVPAHAGVYLSLDGSIGVGAGFASATGGLNVRGDASLTGQIDAKIDLAYKQGRFVVDAKAGVHAGLTLKASLGAFVQAHIGIGPLSAGTRKDWELASYSWGSGSQFGMTAPLHYASDEPFQPPTMDSIQFEKPTIDPKGLLGQLFQSAPPREKKE